MNLVHQQSQKQIESDFIKALKNDPEFSNLHTIYDCHESDGPIDIVINDTPYDLKCNDYNKDSGQLTMIKFYDLDKHNGPNPDFMEIPWIKDLSVPYLYIMQGKAWRIDKKDIIKYWDKLQRPFYYDGDGNANLCLCIKPLLGGPAPLVYDFKKNFPNVWQEFVRLRREKTILNM